MTNVLIPVGLVGGTGLAIGGVFVKGPGGTVMIVLGGLSVGASFIVLLMRMMSQMMGGGGQKAQSAVQTFPPPPPQAPPKPPLSRSQNIQQYASALAPTALSILKNLI
jgi:hypothetical protein